MINKNHSTSGWEEEFDKKFYPNDSIPEPFKTSGREMCNIIKQFIQQKLAERTREVTDDIILHIDDLIDRPYFARLKKEEIKQQILSKYNIE